MEPNELLRHQLIASLTTQHTDAGADGAIRLWDLMATQIISIVGEGGFNALYARSVFLTQSSHPWLAADAPSPATGSRFADLKTSLQAQAPAQADAANMQLMITFTDILASLIGEPLTARILRTAWGHEAQDRTGKEFIHD
jgi:hypothetical protein